MAIQTSDLMMRLQPLTPIPSFGGDSSQLDLERQRLQLMQQEFENTKQNQQQDRALRQLAESARMAHEKAMQDRQLQNDAAARALEQAKAAAEVKKQQQEVIGKFTELNGKGQIREARAMLPLLTSAGVDVSLEGEDNGLPRYRIGPDPEAAARDQGDVGYPTTDSGTMPPPPAVTSTEDAFSRAQAASAQSAATGLPARGPDAPDVSGAVPKNVIDTGALRAETLRSLHPALNSLVAAYPGEQQGAMSNVADAVEQLGLPIDKSMEVLNQLSPSGGAVNQMREGTRQAFEDRKQGFAEQLDTRKQDASEGQAAATLAMGEQKQASERRDHGSALSEKAAHDFGAEKILHNRTMIKDARFTLTNASDTDDYLAGTTIGKLMGDDRVSNDDVKRVLGNDSASFFERMKQKAFGEAIGGLSPPQRQGLLGVLDKVEKEDRNRAFDYLANVDEVRGLPTTDREMSQGLDDYARIVIPADIRAEYRKKNPDGAGTSAPTTAAAGKPAAFNMAADSRAPAEPEGSGVLTNDPRDWRSQAADAAKQAGLDPKAFQGVIGVESGGNPAAHNPSGATGLIQFMPEIAKGLGTTTEAIAQMPIAEQLPLVVKYLKERGIDEKSTQDDMYVAIAAGGFVGRPDSAMVYPVGSKGWQANPAWRPADGGGIRVGDIKAFGGGRGKRPAAATPAAGASLAERMAELRGRYTQ